jgi:membrane-associated phospholipid phosphatase
MLDGFTDVVASTHAFGSWHTGALASAANQVAAMPSLHMAWAAWCTLVLWRASKRAVVRALAVAYPCLTALAVLATGNHFVLDIVGGLAVLAIAVLLVDWPRRIAWRPALPRLRGWRGPPQRSEPAAAALRMSQSCYEVRDAVK